jgi:hypothetical protein
MPTPDDQQRSCQQNGRRISGKIEAFSIVW